MSQTQLHDWTELIIYVYIHIHICVYYRCTSIVYIPIKYMLHVYYVYVCICCLISKHVQHFYSPMDYSIRLLCPQDSSGKNTGMGCHFLLHRIFLTEGSNPGNLRCLSGNEPTWQCRSDPGSGRSPGEGNGTHSNILAWEIPWTREPGWVQSMGSNRVIYDLAARNNKSVNLYNI